MDEKRQKEINRHMAIYVIGTNTPNTIVENPLSEQQASTKR